MELRKLTSTALLSFCRRSCSERRRTLLTSQSMRCNCSLVTDGTLIFILNIGCSLLRSGSGAEYCDQPVCFTVCVSISVSAGISLEPLVRSSRNLLCGSAVVVAQSSSGGVAIRHVLPVLWMTSRLAVVGRVSCHGLRVAKYNAPHACARPGRSLMLMKALLYNCIKLSD